ncbi:SGNH/GDSL hydrolase family protein [Salirhabdus salicampi]|uniref:SGNH/GDSL hydrolase family protein n=1 Tax=Salirhabdus salicampi TaxID=476102 RepID=UPI0020C44F2A|nr:SGNH/GDSL hydrolase family protein [Salirhabdus salicampi]MCP8617346.1 SGNH/GDSL hydrolase family protein [Salirhabdus salicampi]
MKKGTIGSIIFLLIIGVILIVQQLTIEQPVTENETDDSETETEETLPDEETSENVMQKVGETIEGFVQSTIDLLIPRDVNILAIGDSLTQGVGDETENGGYVGLLEEAIPYDRNGEVTIYNYGKRGNRTDQLLKRLEQEEIVSSIEEADIVLITVGANDIMRIVKENFTNLNYNIFVSEQDNYRERLHQIFVEVRNLNEDTHIFLIGLYNPFAQYFENIPELTQIVEDWNNIGMEVVAEYNHTTFIPIKDIFLKHEKDLFYEDHFHPNHDGYREITKRVIQYITPIIENL